MGKTDSSLDSKDLANLNRFASELREIYGDVLLSVALTGEAASASYRAGRTPLQTVVVVGSVTPAVLRAARASLGKWARNRIPTPLFLDPAYVKGALDTFPLEFLEMTDHHIVLEGDRNFFAGIEVDASHLRLEIEEQLRGKLLHLWESFLVSGGRRRELERLLLETLPGFELALRGLLRIRSPREAAVSNEAVGNGGEGERLDGVALIEAVAAELALSLPTLTRLERVRLEGSRLSEPDLDALFEEYLLELREIVARIDRF